jgi:hypothetical protein
MRGKECHLPLVNANKLACPYRTAEMDNSPSMKALPLSSRRKRTVPEDLRFPSATNHS